MIGETVPGDNVVGGVHKRSFPSPFQRDAQMITRAKFGTHQGGHHESASPLRHVGCRLKESPRAHIQEMGPQAPTGHPMGIDHEAGLTSGGALLWADISGEQQGATSNYGRDFAGLAPKEITRPDVHTHQLVGCHGGEEVAIDVQFITDAVGDPQGRARWRG